MINVYEIDNDGRGPNTYEIDGRDGKPGLFQLDRPTMLAYLARMTEDGHSFTYHSAADWYAEQDAAEQSTPLQELDRIRLERWSARTEDN